MSGHSNFATFNTVSQSFGYEVVHVRGQETALRSLREKESAVLFIDDHYYTEDLRKGLEGLGSLNEQFSLVLLISDTSRQIKFDKRIDCGLILTVPANVFEISVFSAYKYIWYKEKLRTFTGLTNPDFIKKLLSDMAHEINNVLTGMQGYAELAQLNPDDKKLIQDSFQVVIDSSYRVRNEIKNLRAFARVENPLFDQVNIGEVLSESIELVRGQIRSKNLELIKNIERVFFMVGDYDQLVQVFFNLLNDVVNNVKEKSTIGLFVSNDDDKAVIGIEGEDYEISGDDFNSLERIFSFNEPILKADSKEGKIENRNVLSICNRIISNHKGSIVVKRDDDGKIIYTLKLPVLQGDFAVFEEEEAPARHAFESIESLDMDILIVDDEEYVRNTIYYLFDKRGCRVTLAEDGEFGLTMAKQKPFDLIFMDYLMPKMGGVEAARRIHEHNKDVKIVFITGRDSLDENELYKAGVYACIQKPFEMKELFEIAKKVAMEKGLID
jgi:CheY-like chemotaxis protein